MSEAVIAPVVTDCDPDCKWRIATDDAISEKDNRKDSVPTAPFLGNEEDIRPTTQGYDQLADIELDYQGLSILSSIGKSCTQACAVERFVFPDGDDQIRGTIGSEIQAKFNDLKGK